MHAILDCLNTFTFSWAQELRKGVEDRREDIPPYTFASVYFEKCIDLYTVVWGFREKISQYIAFDILGRLAHDLTCIHSY